MVKKYQIHIQWDTHVDREYTAKIHVMLPICHKNQPRICDEYISPDKMLFGYPLTHDWGNQHSFDYRSNHYSIDSYSLRELIAEVNREVNRIKDIIHRVYVTNQDRKLPQDEILEIDPRFIAIPIGEPVLSPLDSWRHSLVKGDRVVVWSHEDEMLLNGWVRQVQISEMRFHVDLFEKGSSTYPQRTLFANPEDILPYYCDRRSDNWRFEIRVGDAIRYQNRENALISRSDIIADFRHNISKNELELKFSSDDTWMLLDYMDLYELKPQHEPAAKLSSNTTDIC